MELFDLMVKISVDTDDFNDAVKDARKSADKLGDELGDDLPKATKDASKGLEDAAEATEKMSDGFTVAKGVLATLSPPASKARLAPLEILRPAFGILTKAPKNTVKRKAD